jgi:class 3 adenylate cyclase
VQHVGDGLCAAFPDTLAAVDCAIEIQRTLAEHRRQHGFAPLLRIGIHVAAVTQRGSELSGRGFEEVSQIAALAGPDEILMSVESLPAVGGYDKLEPRTVVLSGSAIPVTLVPIGWH